LRAFTYLSFLLFSFSLFAQDDLDQPASTGGVPIVKEKTKVRMKKSRKPKINIEEVQREFEPPPKEEAVPRNLASEHWSRFTGGLWLNYATHAIARPLLKSSQDEILMKKATERAWGFGGQFDFSALEEKDQGLRARVGFMRSAVKADSAVNDAHPNASLETRVNVFSLSALHRWKYMTLPETGHLWFGWGGQMNYAYSSSRLRASSGSPRSKLGGSYAFNLLLAAGTDYPITDLEDICFEVQYLPSKSFALYFGFRSSL
jgi:hypothetical protein